MKYMLLMQFSAHLVDFPSLADWEPEEVTAHIDFMRSTNAELMEKGEFLQAEGLGGPALAKIVRAGADGTPDVTDGPFAESKEVLAGWWIVDVESDARAVEIAAHISTAPGPGGRPLRMPIEVHPVMSGPA